MHVVEFGKSRAFAEAASLFGRRPSELAGRVSSRVSVKWLRRRHSAGHLMGAEPLNGSFDLKCVWRKRRRGCNLRAALCFLLARATKGGASFESNWPDFGGGAREIDCGAGAKLVAASGRAPATWRAKGASREYLAA